jgi:16S rRNA (cytidine1402-2'-O)-methyltransferase
VTTGAAGSGGGGGAGFCAGAGGAGAGATGVCAHAHNAAAAITPEPRRRTVSKSKEKFDMTKAAWRFEDDALVTAARLREQEFPPAALYVVASPIGNAADVTLRALWVLAHADAIAAEDTRTTRPLLERYGISTPLLAAHRHNERSAAGRIIERLRRGERIALVSDAGTPAVSDPGALIVAAVRDAGLRAIPVPGVSSVPTALSAAGLREGAYAFVGFLPSATAARKRMLAEITENPGATVFFEAPHRIADTLQALCGMLAPDRRVVVARELTKRFESIEAAAARELPALVENRAGAEPRGEYVVLVDAAARTANAAELDEAAHRWLRALAAELPASRAAAVAAKATGLPRARLYEALEAAKSDRKRRT